MAKKGTLIKSAIAAAVGLACAQAFAQQGVIVAPATATKFAKQLFGGTAAPTLTLPVITYGTNTSSGGIPVAPGLCFDYYLTLGNASWTAAATNAALVAATTVAGISPAGAVIVDSAAVSTDNKTIVVRLHNTGTVIATLGLGSQISVAAGATLVSGGATLASGGSITAVGGLDNKSIVTSPVAAACPPATTAIADATTRSLEASSPAKDVAITADGVAVTITQSGAFDGTAPFAGTVAETKVIDVTNANPGRDMTVLAGPPVGTTNTVGNLGLINLGGISLKTVTGVKQEDGVTDFKVGGALAATADGTGNATIKVGVVSGAFLTETTPTNLIKFASNSACTTFVGAPATANTATGVTSGAIANTVYAAAAPIYVCYDLTLPAAFAASRSILPVQGNAQVTVATLLNNAAGGTPFTSAVGSLYDLKQNGKTINVINFLPSAIPTSAFQTFIRVANAGSNGAQLRVQLISETGTVSAAANVTSATSSSGTGTNPSFTGVLAPAASVSLTSKDIENALAAAGVTAPAIGDRPRVRFSGAFGRLQVQAYIKNPDGSFTNMSPDYDSQGTQP